MDEPRRGYVICATQRSGSNYLCQLLESTGLLGRPLDYFNAPGRRAKGWTDYPDDLQRQLELILAHGSTSNGVYGLKAFVDRLDLLTTVGWPESLPRLHWIYLHRADLLGQAISLVIAKQTGSWRSGAPSARTPAYDSRAIGEELASLARDDARWRIYFARRGLQPLELTYETVVADPQAAVDSAAALMSLGVPATIDPSRIDVDVQHGDVGRNWRALFMEQQIPVPTVIVTRRSRLTVSIITKDSQERLPRLLAEAREYADEVIVGVDASSADGTLAAAAAGADVTYRFSLDQPGRLAPARLLPFDYATGDWILSLDDDESMEETFDPLVPQLMRANTPTHYYFPRKWIVRADPYEYIHAPPWFPNWAPRLFRNDRSLVWKPPQAHSMLQLQGPGYYESRTAILHFEPLWCAPERRREKIAAYRNAGAVAESEEYYAVRPDAVRRPVRPRRPPAARPTPATGTVHEQIRDLTARALPPWSATFSAVDMPQVARAGETLVVAVTVRNTGALAWAQQYAQWPANAWPLLRLGYLVSRVDGTDARPHDAGSRSVLPRFVAPGEEITFVDQFTAPQTPGQYAIAWDLVSEGHCWFAQCGSTVYQSRLDVRAAH